MADHNTTRVKPEYASTYQFDNKLSDVHQRTEGTISYMSFVTRFNGLNAASISPLSAHFSYFGPVFPLDCKRVDFDVDGNSEYFILDPYLCLTKEAFIAEFTAKMFLYGIIVNIVEYVTKGAVYTYFVINPNGHTLLLTGTFWGADSCHGLAMYRSSSTPITATVTGKRANFCPSLFYRIISDLADTYAGKVNDSAPTAIAIASGFGDEDVCADHTSSSFINFEGGAQIRLDCRKGSMRVDVIDDRDKIVQTMGDNCRLCIFFRTDMAM